MIEVSQEFLNESMAYLHQSMPRSGPYTKQNKEKRLAEVYRLHFDYGYSGRRISELMKVNRNTINGDISYWYSKIVKNTNIFDPELCIITTIRRFEEQRIRLRENIDKADSFQEKIALERMICDIDTKIIQIYQKLAESTRRISDLSTQGLNEHLKSEKKGVQYLTMLDTMSVSEKAKSQINKIINEDKKRKPSI